MFILNGSANAEVDNIGIFGEFVKTPIETIAYEKIVEFSWKSQKRKKNWVCVIEG